MMSRPHLSRLIRLILIASLTMFACSLVSGDSGEPTAVVPTDVPALPTNTAQPTQPPAPTDEPPTPEPTTPVSTGEFDIQIEMVNGYLDTFSSWNIVGLIRNNTDRVIDDVEIEVELFDANDNSLFVETDYTDLYNIAPGEVSPFSFTVYEDVPDADNFVATVVGNSTSDLERAPLDVLNTRMVFDDSGDAHITGEVMNNNDRSVVINSLSAATFDANGQIQTANSYSVAIRYLEPGEVGPFRFTITGPDYGNEELDSFEVFVDAQFDEPITPYNLAISDAIYYLDSFDNLHLVGEVTNNDSVPLSVSLVAGIYGEDGVVLDAASQSLPVTSLAPGQTVPYDFNFWGPMSYVAGAVDEAALYTIQVDAYWTWESSTQTFTLSSQNDVLESDDFSSQVYGQVVNDSGGTVDSATIIAFLRDPITGEVLAMGYDYIFEELADGATADYSIFLDPPANIDPFETDLYILVVGERP